MANRSPGQAPASDVAVEAYSWGDKVKEARRKGDVNATIATTIVAADAIERRIAEK